MNVTGKITKEELVNILARSERYFRNPLDEDGERAYFCCIDLCDYDFCGMNLAGVVFVDCDLIRANFSKTKLVSVKFINCTMNGCSFGNSDLSVVNFISTNLTGVSFNNATCKCCTFFGCTLFEACVDKARFSDTSFFESYMDHLLNIYDMYSPIDIPLACPDTGSFIAWKKVGFSRKLSKKFIVKLLIQEDALRSSATKAKCRCNKAKVLAIENLDGTDSGLTCVPSDYDENFIYEVGKTVQVDNFDPNRLNECAPGIHFFVDRQTAVNY